MTGPTPHTRGDELLLARISAAAGRAHLGRRRATYQGATHTPHAVPARAVLGLLAFARYGRPCAAKASAHARLDLYEHGMTVAVGRRIHLVRYDTTLVLQKSVRLPQAPARGATTRALTLTDIEGRQVELYGGPVDGAAEKWVPEIQRAVTRAQLPGAWAALDAGERLAFGDVWLTREEVGSGAVSARWPQVRRMEITQDTVRLTLDGSGHNLATGATVPNLFVLRALVERLQAGGLRP